MISTYYLHYYPPQLHVVDGVQLLSTNFYVLKVNVSVLQKKIWKLQKNLLLAFINKIIKIYENILHLKNNNNKKSYKSKCLIEIRIKNEKSK